MNTQSKHTPGFESKLLHAIKLTGYTYCDGRLIERGLKGFTADRVLPEQFKTVFQAADFLVPITKDDVLRQLVSGIDPQFS